MRHEIHFRASQLGRLFGVFYTAGEDHAFCAAIQSYVAGASPPLDLTRLLTQAVADCAGALTPAGLAAAVDARMPALGLPGPAFFAAVSAGPREVAVANAGDFRVHRVVDGRVLDTALERRHTTLGGADPTPLDTIRWPVASPYRVVIVSDEFHGFRPPETYYPQIVADLAAGRAPAPADRNYTTGLVAELIFSRG